MTEAVQAQEAQESVAAETQDTQGQEQEGQEQDARQGAKWTDQDLSKKGGEAARKARSKLLEELGFDNVDSARAFIQAQRDAEEAMKTEAEREIEERYKGQLSEKDSAIASLRKEYVLKDALRDAGIKGERLPLALRVADLDKLQVAEDGIQGIEDVVGSVRDASPEWFGRERTTSEDTTPTETAPSDFSKLSDEEFADLSRRVIAGETIQP